MAATQGFLPAPASLTARLWLAVGQGGLYSAVRGSLGFERRLRRRRIDAEISQRALPADLRSAVEAPTASGTVFFVDLR